MSMNQYEVKWQSPTGQLRTEAISGHEYTTECDAVGDVVGVFLRIYRDEDEEPVFHLSGVPYMIRRLGDGE